MALIGDIFCCKKRALLFDGPQLCQNGTSDRGWIIFPLWVKSVFIVVNIDQNDKMAP